MRKERISDNACQEKVVGNPDVLRSLGQKLPFSKKISLEQVNESRERFLFLFVYFSELKAILKRVGYWIFFHPLYDCLFDFHYCFFLGNTILTFVSCLPT